MLKMVSNEQTIVSMLRQARVDPTEKFYADIEKYAEGRVVVE